jgi:hypothetical protein
MSPRSETRSEPPPIVLGRLTIKTKDSQFCYKLSALGTVGRRNGAIAILSAVASETAIKALRACLHKAAKTTFNVECEGFSPYDNLKPCEQGYRFYAAKLGTGTWHALALARLPGLICNLDDASLWAELQRCSFTTPILPEWLPWLRAELARQGYLTPLLSFQSQGAVLELTTEVLDELVSEGLRQRPIAI